MVETATQTNPVTVTEITPVTTSTPTKERMPAHTISPVKPCQGIDDPDYKPSDCSFNAEGEKITDGMVALEDVHECCGDVTSEKKYIVFHNKLMDLFQCCPICGGPSRGHVINRMTRGYGTMVKVEQTCKDCSYTRTWDSQPSTGHMPLGNLMLSAALLFSGCQVSQILRLFSMMNIQCFSRSTYQRHQNDYVIPTVINGWKEEQASIMAGLRKMKGGLQLAGDCRNDSPGHSAKYGTYTLIEQTTKKVIDLQLIQVIKKIMQIT